MHKCKLSADTCYTTDEPCKQAKWVKPDIKDHKPYDSIYLKYPEQVNPQRQKADEWLSGSGYDCLTGMRVFFGGAVKSFGTRKRWLVVTQYCEHIKHHLIVHFKMTGFMLYASSQ